MPFFQAMMNKLGGKDEQQEKSVNSDEVLQRALDSIRQSAISNRLASPEQMDAIEGQQGAAVPDQGGGGYADSAASMLEDKLGPPTRMPAISDMEMGSGLAAPPPSRMPRRRY